MAQVASLQVRHFRNHSDKLITINPKTTIITGNNGTGKTSLLEALYIALRGISFRGSDKDILQWNEPWYRIDVTMSDRAVRTVKFDASKPNKRKQFTINDRHLYRLPDNAKLPVVLFEPEDLRLLQGSPQRRRQFIDHLISQIDPEYHRATVRYERALRQRNALMKRPYISEDDVFVWNVSLSEYGAYITRGRVAFIEKVNQHLGDEYQSIAKTNDIVSVHYSHTLVDNIQQKLLGELTNNFNKDSLLGYTTIGPHRDDVLFRYNNVPAHTVASRGENRTIVLALKIIEANLIKTITGESPIILLDDVFSELDEERQKNISDSEYQIIITATSSSSDTDWILNLND